jgi:DNA-directed RNA polymerase specialized sigma24 family protein
LKRGGGDNGDGWQRVELSAVEAAGLTDDVLALHEALEKLEALDPRTAQLVKLRFFAGLTNEQAAQVLEISAATAYSDWAYARCWLRLEISGESHEPPARRQDQLET